MKSYRIELDGQELIAEAIIREDESISVFSVRKPGSRTVETHIDHDPKSVSDYAEAFSAWDTRRRLALFKAVRRGVPV